MKLGAVVFSSNTGLGIQTKAFYDHMKPDRTMVIDISSLNKMQTHPEWYPDAFLTTKGLPSKNDYDKFLYGLDAVFLAETPLNYYCFKRAAELGVVTVIQYNYEMLDYYQDPTLPLPTLLGSPTSWGLNVVKEKYPTARLLPVPIDINVPVKQSVRAKTFLHIMGRPACADRNGTNIFLEAAKAFSARSLRFVVRVQDAAFGRDLQSKNPKVTVISGDMASPEALYESGEVLVMPRRFGGLCLPVNEALARGIPVIMPDCSPNEELLPQEWLTPGRYRGIVMTKRKIDLFEVTADALVQKMRYFIDMPSIEDECKRARAIAESRSWEIMKPKYDQLFKELCDERSVGNGHKNRSN